VTNKIVVNEESLKIIAGNIKESGVEDIAIVSVMGAYRTGKSFLLDLFLRYLRHQETVSTSRTELPSGVSGSSCLPPWLVNEGDHVIEGTSSNHDKLGFEWRGGMDKVTEGIWLWSRPYVINRMVKLAGGSESAQKVCVILLDSQGAFDSKMTKDQSATIFGLTAVLSSLQIYNISKQLQEDTIENLHYFMECAGSCMRYLQPATEGVEDIKPTVFQSLQFLIRDWANFESDWSPGECEYQMKMHLIQHLDEAKDKATPEALKKMFSDISLWMLPHPGLQVNRPSWNGKITDLDPEFVKLLDLYVQRVFSASLTGRVILGKPLTSSTFVEVVSTFVDAFVDLVPKGVNLATALARTTNLLTKEQCLVDYRIALGNALESNNGKGLADEDLEKIQAETRSEVLMSFQKSTNFGPPEEREVVKKELVAELIRLDKFYEDENRRRMESALTVFAGLCIVIFVLYGLDKFSDFTCDWYSQTCVKISNVLLMVYSLLSIAILTNVYLLLQSRGKAVTLMALMEMGKAVVALFMKIFESLKRLYNDAKTSNGASFTTDAFMLWSQLVHEIRRGLSEVTSSIKQSKSN